RRRFINWSRHDGRSFILERNHDVWGPLSVQNVMSVNYHVPQWRIFMDKVINPFGRWETVIWDSDMLEHATILVFSDTKEKYASVRLGVLANARMSLGNCPISPGVDAKCHMNSLCVDSHPPRQFIVSMRCSTSYR